MTTHTLLQQALDALIYHRDQTRPIERSDSAITALREAIAAPMPEPVALESVHLTRDTQGMCLVRVNGQVAISDNGDIIDHMATLKWFAAQPAAPSGLAAEVQSLQKAVEYYRAGQEQRAPKWVPSKVWLAGPVRGDYPIGHTTIAHEGEYDCESNRYGAVSVIAENGQRLGVKPSEFEVVAWRENTPDAARK